MGALVKPGCLLDTDTVSGPRPFLCESFGSDVVGDAATRKNVYPEILKSLNLSCQQGTPVLENGRTVADMSKPKVPLPSKAFRQIKADW